MTTLHYVHDPLCGWCYAAAPLVEAAVAAGVRVARPPPPSFLQP